MFGFLLRCLFVCVCAVCVCERDLDLHRVCMRVFVNVCVCMRECLLCGAESSGSAEAYRRPTRGRSSPGGLEGDFLLFFCPASSHEWACPAQKNTPLRSLTHIHTQTRSLVRSLSHTRTPLSLYLSAAPWARDTEHGTQRYMHAETCS